MKTKKIEVTKIFRLILHFIVHQSLFQSEKIDSSEIFKT